MAEEKMIVDAVGVERMLMRMAHEVVEKHRDLNTLALIGIWSRGVPMAERIADNINAITGIRPAVGKLDITFYRDDVYARETQPVVKSTDIAFDINDKDLVVIDDVLFTGRTIRSAMDALMDYGRPRRIMLAVLVDRGHRELPIKADFTGKNLPTMRVEKVKVSIREVDGADEVLISKP